MYIKILRYENEKIQIQEYTFVATRCGVLNL